MANSSDSDGESKPDKNSDHPTDASGLNEMNRRVFMIATAGAVATAATVGTVGARSSPELNAGSDLTPIPRASTTTEIEGVEIGDDPLGFTEDDGTETSLGAYGGEVESTPTDEDDVEQPHNPFSLRADYIDSEEYGEFPRGETYDDGDDEDAPVSALHPTHWSTTSSEASVEEYDPPSGGDGFRLTTDGVTDGNEAGIEFTNVDITSGVSRKEIQAVLSVVSFDGTVELRVGDGSTWAVAKIDSAADAEADGTIATSTGEGLVYQTQVGDLDETLEEISTVQLVAVDEDATIEIAALNVERESSWSYGDREVWDEDEENIETEEFVEPVGEFSIASLDTLDDVFSGGEINPVSVGVEYWPTETLYEVGDPSSPAYDNGLEILDNIEIPSAYDLSHGTIDVELEVGLSTDQWETLEAVAGLSEPIEELEDRDDESFTDYSSNLSGVDEGDDVGLGTVSGDDVVAVNQDVDVTTDQLDEIESGGAVAGGPFGGGGGGGLLSTPLGILGAIVTGLATYVAIARGWVARALGA